jgi:translation initiation factor 5B
LAQKFLEKQLQHTGVELTAGSILEVKEEKGLGMTLDVIVYRGALEEGEPIVFLNTSGQVVKSKIKAILKPGRRGEKFTSEKKVQAAAGVKIACDFAAEALVGSSFYEYNKEMEEQTKEELKKEIREIEIENPDNGVIIKADALGSLEAIVKLFLAEKIPIRSASIGKVLKKDVLEAASVAKNDKHLGVIFAFHSELDSEVLPLAKKEGVKIFDEKVIYNLIINYKQWRDESLQSERKESFTKLTLPAKIYVMENSCFRVSNPCIFGITVLEGRLRKENTLMNDKGEKIGEIRSIQVEKEPVEEAKKGKEVAIAVDGPYFGRQIREKQTLYTDISEEEIDLIEKKYLQSLSEDEQAVLKEIKKIKGFLTFTF